MHKKRPPPEPFVFDGRAGARFCFPLVSTLCDGCTTDVDVV